MFEIVSGLLGVLFFAAFVACIVLWVFIGKRLIGGGPAIPMASRKLVPWGPDGFIAAIVFIMIAGSLLKAFAERSGWVVLPEVPFEEQDVSLESRARLLMVFSVASLVAMAVSCLWLVALHKASPRNFGFAFSSRTILLGFAASVALIPPVLLLQGALTQLWEYQHPVIDVLKDNKHPRIFLAMTISTVLVAPLTEEFTFRVVLQGWLEAFLVRLNKLQSVIQVPTNQGCSIDSGPQDSRDIESAESNAEPTADPANPYAAPEASLRERPKLCDDDLEDVPPPYWPIFVSSAVFALFHLGHGPAPITLFFFSLGLGYLYRQTQSIWPSVIVHMCLNALTMAALWYT